MPRCRGWVRHLLAATAAGGLSVWLVTGSTFSDAYVRGGMVIVAACAAVVIWYLMSVPQGWAGNALSLTPIVWVGRRSYTIYLVHYPLFGLLAAGRRSVEFVAVVALSLAYAWVSFRYIERPFLARRTVARP